MKENSKALFSFFAKHPPTGLSLSLKSSVTSVSAPIKNCYFVVEFYQQQAISLITSRKNQALSAITGVTGYGS